MSGKGKGKRKEEYAYDGSSDELAPPKKASKTDAVDDSDDIVVCEISKNRRVSVRNWNGKVWIDIREFYVKDGKQFPGKKENGLRNTDRTPFPNSFMKLMEYLTSTKQKLDYCPSIHIIEACRDGDKCPYLDSPGISLSVDQWNVLRDHAEEIDKALGDNS